MDFAAERAYNTLVSNSTLFPLLLMSLAYQKNSPDTSSKIWRSYDYIVVGGGTAGSAVAARLSELPCVRVLVLEAGPPPPIINDVLALGRNFWFTDLDWQYKTVPQKHTGNGLKNNQLTWPGGKALGGSSILNAAMFVRGNRKDYDSWEEDGAKGWSFDDVLPYFKKLEDNQDPEYIENGFHGVGGPVTIMKPHYRPRLKDAVFKAAEEMGYRIVDPNTGIQTGFYDVQATLRNNQRCSAAKAYLVPAENRTNLDILANAHVRKVIFKNGRAFGVLFDYDGRTHFVKSTREVILSAGAINTAQVLMLSGIGPKEELEKHGALKQSIGVDTWPSMHPDVPAPFASEKKAWNYIVEPDPHPWLTQAYKIPVIADLPVGKNLQDHGGTVMNFVLSPDIEEFTEKLSDDENIKRFIETRTGPLASPEGVSNIAFLQDDEIDPAEDAPNYQLYFSEGSTTIPKEQWNLKDEVYRSVYQPYEMQPIMICFVQQLHPKSRGSVTLQSADPYDPPLIDPNYLSYPEEVDELVEGMKTCKRVANNRHMRRVVSRQFNTFYPGCEKYAYDDDAYFRCQARTEFLTLSHPAGTAKMGDPEDPNTVVDSKLRVKYVQGLRVVDNSIMPTLIRGNTGVPAMMIGEKAADIIKQDIPCYNQRKFPLDDYF